MKKKLLFLSITLTFILTFSLQVTAQDYPKMTNRDQAVICEAEAVETPAPKIILKWEKKNAVISYKIQRKLLSGNLWTLNIATLDSNATSFEDTNVEPGVVYEYRIFADCRGKIQNNDTHYLAFGFITSGIKAKIPSPGKLLVLVDRTFFDALQPELEQYKEDVVAEGWDAVIRTVPRAEEFNKALVDSVKAIILDEATPDMFIFLVGRVPVPYSGNLNPDGHSNHQGAWPADVFYSDATNNRWTDYIVNNISASRDENKNSPGDGKFDQSIIPVNINYPLGRVDFYNMPEFKKSELELLKQYFQKNHKYRIGMVATQSKCIVDDNFQSYIEGFATSGWRTSPLVGIENVTAEDFMTSLETENHIWAYGTGGGSYTSAGGIGHTADFASKELNGIFTMLFCSYFGDWDVKNSFLRAPLASSPSILTCSWAGRPQWFYQHMGLGFPIGYSAMLTINNNTLYQSNYLYTSDYPNGVVYTYGNKQVHQELLGDPTLRMFMGNVPEIKSVSAYQPAGKPVNISWQRVFEDNDGYNVYKSTEGHDGPYVKLNDEPLHLTRFTDSNLVEGEVFYMVRVVKNTITPSGSFLNEGRGEIQSIISTGVDDYTGDITLKVAPVPASEYTNININLPHQANVKLYIVDLQGNKITTLINEYLSAGTQEFSWDLSSQTGAKVSSGVYLLKAQIDGMSLTKKIIVLP